MFYKPVSSREVIDLVWAKVCAIRPHNSTMVSNNLVEDAIIPYSGKALVTTVWCTVEYAMLAVSENNVKPVVWQGLNPFYAIHQHVMPSQRIGSTQTTSLPSMQSFQLSISSSVSPIRFRLFLSTFPTPETRALYQIAAPVIKHGGRLTGRCAICYTSRVFAGKPAK